MARRHWRSGLWVHKSTSLVCTLFLLIICVSGLPLVLKDELEALLDGGLPYAQVPAGTPNVSLDRLAPPSRAMYPGESILSILSGDREPENVGFLAGCWGALQAVPPTTPLVPLG